MIDVTIIGTMPEVAYNSDAKVFWTGGQHQHYGPRPTDTCRTF